MSIFGFACCHRRQRSSENFDFIIVSDSDSEDSLHFPPTPLATPGLEPLARWTRLLRKAKRLFFLRRLWSFLGKHLQLYNHLFGHLRPRRLRRSFRMDVRPFCQRVSQSSKTSEASRWQLNRIHVSIENPWPSELFSIGEIKDALTALDTIRIKYDCCPYGANGLQN